MFAFPPLFVSLHSTHTVPSNQNEQTRPHLMMILELK